MHIEAVVVCDQYGDYLAETLPHNLPHVDRMVVVTSLEDKETQELCRRFGITCRPTDLLRKNGDPFAKARGIDYGIAYLRQDAWILHMDADIVMPPMARKWLEWVPLDEECIYGADRVLCPNYEEWTNYRITRDMQHDYWCRVNPPSFPLGARLSIREYGGYIPIGYWQLWHGKHGRRYPLFQSSAEHTDVLHAIQWPAKLRKLIPDFLVVHLEEANHKMGVNWNGRTTPRFAPKTACTPVTVATVETDLKKVLLDAIEGKWSQEKQDFTKLLEDLKKLISGYNCP